MNERVLVRTVTDLPAAVDEALDFLGCDFNGQRVWVKPNLLGPHPPERSVTTEPELLRLVVRGLKRRAAKQVLVGDSPGGAMRGNLEEFIAPTGLVEASEGCFVNIGRRSFSLPVKSRFTASVQVSTLLNEVDVILSLPVFKTHALTLLTGAVKNLFGIVVGGHKTALHALAPGTLEFSELIVDIYRAIPVPMLHIMDALRGMDGQMGPSGGRTLRIGKLLAARNGVALDCVMAAMAGTRPDRIPVTRIAAERGLGPGTLDAVEVTGDFAPIPGFKLPARSDLALRLTSLSRFIFPLLKRRPILIPDKCVRCAECFRNCPVKAITMSPEPVIARDACILCYCCCETCPEHAFRIPSQSEGMLRNLSGR